jgi:hypothetical protein
MHHPQSCGFPPCPHPAAETLRLLVEGDDLAIVACHQHAHWLRCYVEEDALVRIVDGSPEGSREHIPPSPYWTEGLG